VKYGFDIHGVMDSDPTLFHSLTHALVNAGHEVHIITGPKKEVVEPFLKANNIAYTHFFSIVEDAEKNDMNIKWDKEGHPWIDPQFWDRAKARYCAKNKIDIHLDDSPEYGKYFKTPYALFKK